MKTWKLPIAVAQKFAANEYVAACYQIFCAGPNDNSSCSKLYADSDKDGVYDEGVDVSVVTPPYAGATFRGCGGYEKVIGKTEPENNGFVKQGDEYLPVFYWFGNVIDPTEDGDMADFHFADLTRENAVIYDGNAS